MFNRNSEFTVTFFSGGIRTCAVRFPTDDQWKKRASSLKIVRREEGRGVVSTTVPNLESVSAKLYAEIATDKTAKVDGADAAEILRRLEHVQLSDEVDEQTKMTGDSITLYVDALMLQGEECTVCGLRHILSLPTQKQIISYRRSALRVTPGSKVEETVAPLEPGEALYDELLRETEGYVDEVPVIHKDFIISSMLTAIDEMMKGSKIPEAPTPA